MKHVRWKFIVTRVLWGSMAVLLILLAPYVLPTQPFQVRGILNGLNVSTVQPMPPEDYTPEAKLDSLPMFLYMDRLTLDGLFASDSAQPFAFDADGYVVHNYGQRNQRAGWQYSPLSVATVGITALQDWRRDHALGAFYVAERQVDWFVAHADWSSGFPVWRYDFPNEAWRATPGWISGMSNAAAAVLYTQMAAATSDPKYAEYASEALIAFTVPMQDGGLATPGRKGGVWFEEVAQPNAIPSQILNGHVFATVALAYVADHGNNALARDLALDGIAAIEHHIADYERSGVLLYDAYTPRLPALTHYSYAIVWRGLYKLGYWADNPSLLAHADRLARRVTAV